MMILSLPCIPQVMFKQKKMLLNGQ